MHIIICLDDRNGISFNKRRLSSDRTVSERILQNTDGTIWMNNSSAKLFPDGPVCVADDFLNHAKDSDTCFVESPDFMQQLPRVHMITVYRWNRHYPSDVRLPEDLLMKWELISTNEFSGNSHEKITEERYIP